jgi:hypothetical protein
MHLKNTVRCARLLPFPFPSPFSLAFFLLLRPHPLSISRLLLLSLSLAPLLPFSCRFARCVLANFRITALLLAIIPAFCDSLRRVQAWA